MSGHRLVISPEGKLLEERKIKLHIVFTLIYYFLRGGRRIGRDDKNEQLTVPLTGTAGSSLCRLAGMVLGKG